LHSESYELVNTPNGSSVHESVADSDLEINLTQPYALSDFLATVTSWLNSAPWPNWTNAQRTGWAERGGRNVITYINEDRAEFNAALTKLKYRIAVKGPKDDKQTITWIERFTPNGGGPVVDTSLSEEVTFTGQEQYLMATQQEQGKIVDPPAQTGRIEVLVLSTRECDSPNCGPGKGTVSTGSIDVRMSLGKTASGQSAGYLMIKEDVPRSDIATPQRLGYFLDPDVQVIKDGAVLRQVSAPQTLAHVVPITYGYEVRFFGPTTNKDVNGYFIPTGQPFFTWRIESPTNNPNYLTVTQIGAGDSLVSQFAWSAPDQAWALVISNFRKEIRVWTTNGIDRTETFTVREMNDSLTYKEVRTWRQYGGVLGDLLISETIGEGGAALTTTYTYSTNPANPGSYGKVWTITRPNGAYESYAYDSTGRPTIANRLGRSEEYFYTPVDPLDNGSLETNIARTVIEKFSVHEVRRTYRSVRTNETLGIHCQTPGASWNAADNLITTNRSYFAGNLKVESSRYPDGTLRIVQTPTNYPGTRTESFGQPNATGDAVVDGTRNTTQFDGTGRITLRETVDIASGSALSRETYEYADPFGPATRVVYLDGTSASTTYGCCNATATVDRDGTLTTYTYDALDRLASTTRTGITWTNTYDAMGNVVRTTRIGTDATSMIVSSYYQSGQLMSVTRTGASGEELDRTTYGYDAHKRAVSMTDARTGTATTLGYNAADQIIAFAAPALPGIPSQSTALHYDGVGRITRAVLPDNLNLTNQFNGQGQLTKTFGVRTYPVDYAYDSQGRLANMLTSSTVGGANTGWGYHQQRGWLATKRYVNGLGPTSSSSMIGAGGASARR
jgi:YD repeat-containing protein